MNEQEFAEIIKKTKGAVFAAIQRHLPPYWHHAIDDIAQETYIRAFRNLQKNARGEPASYEAWLYVIARNETHRAVKRLQRDERIMEMMRRFAPVSGHDDRKEFEWFDGMIESMIEKLPATYREVMALVASGHSEMEISKRLSISRGTVKSRTSRGKELLQRMAHGGAT